MEVRDLERSMGGPALVVVGGLLASGKTTASRALAEALAAQRIEADALRAARDRAGEHGAFAPGFSEVVYEEMLARAEKTLGEGRRVVLDATFRTRAWRARARELAERHGAAFRFVECRADDAVIRERLAAREDPQGWLAMYGHFLTLWEPVDELPAQELFRIDTTRPRAAIPGPAQLGLEPA